MLSHDKNHQLFYLVKVTNIGVANDDIIDDFKHTIYKGEKYIEGRYLDMIGEKNKYVKYCEVTGVLFIRTQEINHVFVDINPATLIMSKQEYCSLLQSYC